MARFFFQLYECGDVTFDVEGRQIADLDHALTEAIQAARDVMCAEVNEGRLCLSCCIVIEDSRGREVGRVPFKEAITVSGY